MKMPSMWTQTLKPLKKYHWIEQSSDWPVLSNTNSLSQSMPRVRKSRKSTRKGRKTSRRGTRVIKGKGDYTIARGAASMRYASNIPKMHSSQGVTNIKNSEFTGIVVYGNSNLDPDPAFTVHTRFINAGNVELFPWLGEVAVDFQQYRFKGLAFEYRPTSGEGITGANPPIGSVTMSTVYDVYRDDPTTLAQQRTEQYVNTCKPSHSMIHGVECSSKNLDFTLQRVATSFSRTDFSHGDQRFMHMGNLSISVSGTTQPFNGLVALPGLPLGEIWASYDVDLSLPTTLNLGIPSGLNLFRVECSGVNNSIGLGDVNNQVPFGDFNQLAYPILDTLGVTPLLGYKRAVAGSSFSPTAVNAFKIQHTKFPRFLMLTIGWNGSVGARPGNGTLGANAGMLRVDSPNLRLIGNWAVGAGNMRGGMGSFFRDADLSYVFYQVPPLQGQAPNADIVYFDGDVSVLGKAANFPSATFNTRTVGALGPAIPAGSWAIPGIPPNWSYYETVEDVADPHQIDPALVTAETVSHDDPLHPLAITNVTVTPGTLLLSNARVSIFPVSPDYFIGHGQPQIAYVNAISPG
jgi:hypothetical protein